MLLPRQTGNFNSQAQAQGVIQAGETIMTLVPQNGLKARILVSNKDIGFVKTGQSAQIRVDAFPFTRYGELTGSVAQIGADALPQIQPLLINMHFR